MEFTIATCLLALSCYRMYRFSWKAGKYCCHPEALVADFTLDHSSGWGGRIKQNDVWKFHSYTGTNLGYDIMCESVNSDQEEKEGDVLNDNHIINLKNFITNIDIFWCAKSVHSIGNYI